MGKVDLSKVSLLKESEGATFFDHLQAFVLNLANIPLPKFDHLWEPFEKRVQTLWVQYHVFQLVSSLPMMFLLAYYNMFWIYIPYMTYIYFDRCYERGGRPSKWFKSHPMWRKITDYFPMKLIKEADLDPNGKYMFVYHPHGIMVSGVIAFVTEALGFSKLFPGIELHALTLPIVFNAPFFREVVIGTGLCLASKASINYLFDKGHSCLIVPGGVEESFYAVPQTADLILKNRRGFIRLAITNGASLVPVYVFGENDLFNVLVPEPGSIVYRIQYYIKSVTRYCLPLFSGRNIFTSNYGIIPYRHPVNVVVGPPLHVEQDPTPSADKINKVHQQYMDAIKALYDRNKEQYSCNEVIPEINFM